MSGVKVQADLFKAITMWCGERAGQRKFGELEEWLESFKTTCEFAGIKDEAEARNMSANLINVLDPAALAALDRDTLKLAWVEVEKAMKKLWGIQGGDFEVAQQMQTAKQGADEPVAAYAIRFKRLCKLMSTEEQKKPDAWHYLFRGGLREAIQERLYFADDLGDFAKIEAYAIKVEATQPKPASNVMLATQAPQPQEVLYSEFKPKFRGGYQPRGRGAQRGGWRGKFGGRGRGAQDQSEMICHNCEERGHAWRNCPHPYSGSQSAYTQPEVSNGNSTKEKKKEKKKKRKTKRGIAKPSQAGQPNKTTVPSSPTGSAYAVMTEALERDIKLPLTIAGTFTTLAVADTGADVSLVSERLAEKIGRATGIPIQPLAAEVQLRGANGQELQVLGELQVQVQLGQNQLQGTLLVVRDLPRPCLVGKDLLGATSAVIFTAERRVAFPDAETLVQWAQQAGVCKRTRKRREDEEDVKPGECLVVTKKPTVQELKALRANRKPNPAIVERIKFGKALPDLLQPTKDLLKEFSDCFAEDADDFGHANVEPLKLKLKDRLRPVQQQPRRLNYVHEVFAKEELERWKRANRIGPSTSPVAVCAHVVPKPSDGKELKWRYVINFPAINDQIETDVHPCGNADLIFDNLHGAACFNKFDFSNAFLQIPMDEESRWLTSFVTEDEQLEFYYVPFGIKPAPAKLQRELNNIFRGLVRYKGYADDWIGAPRDKAEHLSTLRDFLTRVRESGFLLKPEKCQLLFDELKFLGRQLTLKGIGPDQDSLDVVRDWPTPNNVEELHRFLGLGRWYAPFVKNYAELAKPLYSSIKQASNKRKKGEDAVFAWGREQDSAFSNVKEGILKSITLTHIDPSKPFVVETDASRKALAAVLLQDNRVVKLLHRVLKPSEVDKPITLLELSAVIFALEKWELYLRGRHFTIVTDHEALTWLRKQGKSSGKLSEWALQLAHFDFDIKYRPGKDHVLADAISRRAEPDLALAVMKGQDLLPTTAEFLKQQSGDEDCKQVIKRLNANDEKTAKNYVVNMNGILCQLGSKYSYPVLKPVVPKSLANRVIAACHQEAGHRSGATESLATAEFFWNGMQEQIERWMKACESCQARRGPNTNRKIPSGHITAQEINELVMVDLLSLMPTKEGWSYVMVAIDAFSRFAVAAPLKTKTAREVADAFERTYIKRHGIPKTVHSDQGGEFEGEFNMMLRKYRINKSWTTAYHPQGDGIVERANRTLVNMLATTLEGKRQDWPLALDQVMQAFNAAPHRFTKTAPEFVMLGQQPSRLASVVVPQPEPSKNQVRKRKQELKKLRRHLAKRNKELETATKHIAKNTTTFKKGQLVGVMLERLKQEAYGKLNNPWVGPCRVLKVGDGGVTYVVQEIGGPTAGTFNVKNVKEWEERDKPRPGRNKASQAQKTTSPEATAPTAPTAPTASRIMDSDTASKTCNETASATKAATEEENIQEQQEDEEQVEQRQGELQNQVPDTQEPLAQQAQEDQAEREPPIGQEQRGEASQEPLITTPAATDSRGASAKMGVNAKFQNSEGGGDEHTETTRRSTRVKNAPEYLNDFETSSLKKKATSAGAPKSS